jgi:predicted nuclease of predicted toxin-antitoxin system
MQAASDDAILAKALAEDRIVVSADTDFAAILAKQEASHPSFVGSQIAAGLITPLKGDFLRGSKPGLNGGLPKRPS